MLTHLVPLLVTLSAVTSYAHFPYSSNRPTSAASQAQINFAIENKYDNTGPGAKKQEYAYNTYKTLDEALIAYLDDPDTKLPEYEREKAVQKLILKSQPSYGSGYLHHNHGFAAGNKLRPLFNSYDQNSFNHLGGKLPTKAYPTTDFRSVLFTKVEKDKTALKEPVNVDQYKFQNLQSTRNNPLRLDHYVKDSDLKSAFDNFDPYPKYSFSYGVNDKSTGDVKQAAESRDGGTVRGFYTFLDADGKHRTVHYTADDAKGFVATVSKRPFEA